MMLIYSLYWRFLYVERKHFIEKDWLSLPFFFLFFFFFFFFFLKSSRIRNRESGIGFSVTSQNVFFSDFQKSGNRKKKHTFFFKWLTDFHWFQDTLDEWYPVFWDTVWAGVGPDRTFYNSISHKGTVSFRSIRTIRWSRGWKLEFVGKNAVFFCKLFGFCKKDWSVREIDAYSRIISIIWYEHER